MEMFITIAILITLIGSWVYYHDRKRKKLNESVEESLDDESIFVDGVGKVKFEDLHDMVNGDPNEGVKHVKDTMFREDLMQFEGEFPISGLPLSEERRLSIDDAFLYLKELLGEDIVVRKASLTHDDAIFSVPVKQLSEIIPLAKHIAGIMEISPESIDISFFEGSQKDLSGGSMAYEQNNAAGLYYGKNQFGKYEVGLADDLYKDMDRLVATIAHEFAHIKLLGEERMNENSEELTDMVPLMYGFGLFNSNMAFKFSRDNSSWSTNKLGYLSQVDWSYLMALYLYVREEENPIWLKYLNKTIAKDCSIALDFIKANPDLVLQPQQDS